MEIHNVRDVFTPTRPAKLNFVERDLINDKLVDALHTPGKQIVVYGHTGSGKTTLLVNKLHQIYENHITIRCITGLTFDQLLLDAFDQLGIFYTSESIGTTKSGISSSIQSEYLGVKSTLQAHLAKEQSSKQQRILPPQLTAQRLARFLGEAKQCLVLEDFHKVSNSEKTKLSQLMKVFVDMAYEYPDLKIISIGAVGTAREVVEYDNEMRNRVAEVYVPLMSIPEIMEILTRGEKLLNIEIAQYVKDAIVKHSNGLASICHQLALNMCFAAQLFETNNEIFRIESKDFESALSRYIEDESDTIKAIFDKALRKKKKQAYDNAFLILQALAEFDFDEGAHRSQLMDNIHKQEPNYPEGNLTFYLKQLQSEEAGAIVRQDPVSGRFTYSNPFYRVFALVLFSRLAQKKPFTYKIELPIEAGLGNIPYNIIQKHIEEVAILLLEHSQMAKARKP